MDQSNLGEAGGGSAFTHGRTSSTAATGNAVQAREAGVSAPGVPFFGGGLDEMDAPPDDSAADTRPPLDDQQQAEATADLYGAYMDDLAGDGGDDSDASSVQMRSTGSAATTDHVQRTAAAGVQGGGSALPHFEAIQASFGPHDVSGVRAHVGGSAGTAAAAIGAEAYATGNDVAFAQSPDLHTAAHEAAHVVQQRAGVQLLGGVGEAGDVYEQNADAVADAVVRGESAAQLLGVGAPCGAEASAGLEVQRKNDNTIGSVAAEHAVGAARVAPIPKTPAEHSAEAYLGKGPAGGGPATDRNGGAFGAFACKPEDTGKKHGDCWLPEFRRQQLVREIGLSAAAAANSFCDALNEIEREELLAARDDGDGWGLIIAILFTVGTRNLTKPALAIWRKAAKIPKPMKSAVTTVDGQLKIEPTRVLAMEEAAVAAASRKDIVAGTLSTMGRAGRSLAKSGLSSIHKADGFIMHARNNARIWGTQVGKDANTITDPEKIAVSLALDPRHLTPSYYLSEIRSVLSRHSSVTSRIKSNSYEAVRFSSMGQERLAICTATGFGSGAYVFEEWVDEGMIPTAEKQQIVTDGDIIDINLQMPAYQFTSPDSAAFNSWVVETGAKPQKSGRLYMDKQQEKFPMNRGKRRSAIYKRRAEARLRRMGGGRWGE